MSFEAELSALLTTRPPGIADTAAAVVTCVQLVRPDLSPKVRTGWGSVNFRHARAGFVCAVFPMQEHVDLVFEHGRLLSNDSGLLQGDGRQVRYVRFRPGDHIPEDDIALLLAEAIALRS
jgi:hypothetical protein